MPPNRIEPTQGPDEASAAAPASAPAPAAAGGLKPWLPLLLTVLAMPAKDGSNTGYLREIKTGDGRDFKIGALPTEGENN